MNDRGNDYRGIHVLVDDDPRWDCDPVEQARKACSAGVPVVQLRAKNATDEHCLEWAKEIRAITRIANTRFVVNDRFDIALLAEADAVHLGQTDLPPAAIAAEFRARLAIGRSTHTEAQLKATRSEDVDYVAFGPVFGTTSKESEFGARGLEALALAAKLAFPRPLIAIGGIQLSDVPDLRDSGAAGIAVISAIVGSTDPADAAHAFIRAFDHE